jgi:hypothetical protein
VTTVSALTLPIGTAGYDTSNISGAVSGTAVTYNLFMGKCPAQANNVPIFTSTVNVNNGNVPNSLPYSFSTVGAYYWVVVYGGSPIVTGPCEPLTVTPALTTTLTVIKVVVGPSGNSDTFNVKVDMTSPFGGVIVGFVATGNGSTSVLTNLVTGSYQVSESGFNLSQYTATYSGGCSPTGAVTLVTGDNKICTVTNTKNSTATLTVIKRVVPAFPNPNRFNLIITGPAGSLGSGTTLSVGDLGTTGPVTISANVNYTVSEAAGGGGTILNEYTKVYSGSCTQSGIVHLAANTNGICTITNTKKARLIVKKILIPAFDSGKFDLEIDHVSIVFNQGNGGTTGVVLVNPSPSFHTVGEAAANNITNLSNYLTTYSPANCAGQFTIPPGVTKICIITNKRIKK